MQPALAGRIRSAAVDAWVPVTGDADGVGGRPRPPLQGPRRLCPAHRQGWRARGLQSRVPRDGFPAHVVAPSGRRGAGRGSSDGEHSRRHHDPRSDRSAPRSRAPGTLPRVRKAAPRGPGARGAQAPGRRGGRHGRESWDAHVSYSSHPGACTRTSGTTRPSNARTRRRAASELDAETQRRKASQPTPRWPRDGRKDSASGAPATAGGRRRRGTVTRVNGMCDAFAVHRHLGQSVEHRTLKSRVCRQRTGISCRATRPREENKHDLASGSRRGAGERLRP